MPTEAARDVVLESALRWNCHRYGTFAACVMPDHVHPLIEPMIERENDAAESVFFSRSRQILYSIKSFTANRINKLERSKEPVWGDRNRSIE